MFAVWTKRLIGASLVGIFLLLVVLLFWVKYHQSIRLVEQGIHFHLIPSHHPVDPSRDMLGAIAAVGWMVTLLVGGLVTFFNKPRGWPVLVAGVAFYVLSMVCLFAGVPHISAESFTGVAAMVWSIYYVAPVLQCIAAFWLIYDRWEDDMAQGNL